jgi:hypothetical protein
MQDTERVALGYMEMMITRRCSLHCDGCIPYSNYGFKEQADLADNKEFIRMWSKRIHPQLFRILGGEPSLHDDLLGFVELIHSAWPDSNRWLVTNASHLHRHPELPKLLAATNTKVLMSFHSDEPKYLEQMKENIFLVRRWITDFGITAIMEDYRLFRRGYRGIGQGMRPYQDGNAVASYANCGSRGCLNLRHGRLWKCPQIMMLRPTLERFGLQNHPDWLPYLGYQGLGLDASDEELRRFLATGPEAFCAMCPINAETYRKDIRNVDFTRPEDHIEYAGEPIDYSAFYNSVCC